MQSGGTECDLNTSGGSASVMHMELMCCFKPGEATSCCKLTT